MWMQKKAAGSSSSHCLCSQFPKLGEQFEFVALSSAATSCWHYLRHFPPNSRPRSLFQAHTRPHGGHFSSSLGPFSLVDVWNQDRP